MNASAARLILIIALTSALVSCERRPQPAPDAAADADASADASGALSIEPTPSPSQANEEGALRSAQLGGELVARGRGITLTIEELTRDASRGILFAPDAVLAAGERTIPMDRLAQVPVQLGLLRAAILRALAEQEAKTRGIVITDAQIDAQIAEDPRLARFTLDGVQLADGTKLPVTLAQLGMSLDDLRALARETLLQRAVEDALLAEVSEQTLWTLYQADQDRVSALIVAVDNVPTSEELDAFLRTHGERVEAKFNADPMRYAQPSMTRLTMLRHPDNDLTKLQQAVEALAGEEKPEQLAQRLGLSVEPEQQLLRDEDRPAQQADPGKAGLTRDGARGTYAWLKLGTTPVQPATLDRPLRREIAAALLREEAPTPAASRKVQAALLTMRDMERGPEGAPSPESIERVTSALRQIEGLRVTIVPPFPREAQGFIPTIGLAQEVSEAAFKLSPEQPVWPEPVLSRQVVYGLALLSRERPDRAEFEAKRDALRASYAQTQRTTILEDALLNRPGAEPIEVDSSALRARFGAPIKPSRTP